MDLTIERLDEFEHESATAPAALLSLRIVQVQRGLPGASPEVAEYASALLLKLEHLLHAQRLEEGEAAQAPGYLAPWMGIGAAERAAA